MAALIFPDVAEVARIVRCYGLEPVEVEAIDGGWSNSSFVLSTTAGRYVLTVFDNVPPDRVERHGELLGVLAENGFPSPRSLPKSTGGFSLALRDKPILIKRFISGKVVPHLSAEQLLQAGETLATLHRLDPPESLRRGHSYDLELYPAVVDRNPMGDFECWLSSCRDEFEKSLVPGLPTGLIHGDLFHDNLLFDLVDTARLAAILDFEEACHHLLVFDIGMAAVGIATESSGLRIEGVRQLVAGYQRIRQLRRCERETLAACIIYAAAATACWRFWKYCIDDPSLGLDDRYLEMVALTLDLQQVGTRKLTESIFRHRETSFDSDVTPSGPSEARTRSQKPVHTLSNSAARTRE